jgi:hypothetical protein
MSANPHEPTQGLWTLPDRTSIPSTQHTKHIDITYPSLRCSESVAVFGGIALALISTSRIDVKKVTIAATGSVGLPEHWSAHHKQGESR